VGAGEALGWWMRAAATIGNGRAIARAIRRDGGSKTAELECFVSMRVARMREGGSDGYSIACARDAALIFYAWFELTDGVSSFFVWRHFLGKATVRKAADTEDYGLYIPHEAKHYGVSKSLSEPFDPSEGMTLQFEARHETGLTCGGAYLKYLTADESFAPEKLDGETPYTVMFGPDKCGSTNKVHVIFRHKSPVDGSIEEKHLKNPPPMPTDENVHQYTLVVNANNTYAVSIDGEEKASGSLFEDFEPPFNPPAEIDDPSDEKPEDWVDEAQIEDPSATKPEDWDEDAPAMIPDMDAVKPADWLDDEEPEIEDEEAVIPEDWDVDEDGDWEAPMVPNPACQDVSGCGEWERPEKANPDYKGKWYPPMIDNPAYKGEWKAKQIPNPKFFEDSAPLKSIGNIGAVGVEIWTMSGGLVFDNILIDKTFEDIKAFSADTFEAKAEAVKKAVEAKAEKRAAEDEKRRARESSPPIGIDLYENLANKLPVGRDKALAVLSKLTVNPVIYYLLHIVSLFAVIVGLIMRFKGDGKAAKAQQQKDAKKKKNDDASDDEDANDEEEEEEKEEQEEPAAEEKKEEKKPKRRLRRSS